MSKEKTKVVSIIQSQSSLHHLGMIQCRGLSPGNGGLHSAPWKLPSHSLCSVFWSFSTNHTDTPPFGDPGDPATPALPALPSSMTDRTLDNTLLGRGKKGQASGLWRAGETAGTREHSRVHPATGEEGLPWQEQGPQKPAGLCGTEGRAGSPSLLCGIHFQTELWSPRWQQPHLSEATWHPWVCKSPVWE